MRIRIIDVMLATVAIVCALGSSYYAMRLHRALHINEVITSARVSGSDSNLPEARLAQALSLSRRGDYAAALKGYKSMMSEREELRELALYDLGNLNMREALKNGEGEARRALPLIELAKQSYRDLLRDNPEDWDARYNLERALWLSPEYEDPVLGRNQAPVHSEHAISTLQGARIDLP